MITSLFACARTHACTHNMLSEANINRDTHRAPGSKCVAERQLGVRKEDLLRV